MKKLFAALPLFLFAVALAVPVQAAAQQYKDFIFSRMPDYTLYNQEKNFERLTVKTFNPETKQVTEKTYEGNRVYSQYEYTGNKTNQPSPFQTVRNYKNAVMQLKGKTLFEKDDELHASFTRNDKQYFIVVETAGSKYYKIWILEPAEMQMDIKILDAETISYKLEKEGFVTLYVHFDFDKAIVKPESYSLIDEIALALTSTPAIRVRLEGHTDNVGTAEYNKKLSTDRAHATMNAIIAKGIDKSRLSADGFGLEKPIADNSTEEGRAKNRRVEMVRL